ncbi:MAG: alpha/beta fold hydrolase [Deltaproteobacteria bacterium]|nr:alpha/beta fold hydrolase [Deltaproteobacteria bacterium]
MTRRRRVTLLAAACAALLAAVAVVTYPAIGGAAYRLDMALESAAYGLSKTTVDGGDRRLSSYVGGPAGAPQAVVMIHGYSADKTVWLRFARHFTERYQVLIVDLPGHGETPFDPALRYDTASQGERVLRAMDSLGIHRAHVVGNSMGGFVTARLALDHPDRVASATLVNAAGVTAPEPSDMDRMLASGRNPFQIHSRGEFADFYRMTMAKPPWVPRMALDFMADRYMAEREQLARIFADFHGVDLLDARLDELHLPVLVVWGAQDRLLHVSTAERWVAGIANARKVIYPELGHMPMVEDPARTARDVIAFVESVA